MSKLYDKYLELKKIDSNKLYLFKCGKFYIFLDSDCDFVNEYVVLKKVKLTNDIYKCGFPVESLDSYLHVFNNHNLQIEIINDLEEDKKYSKIIETIKKIDVNKITPMDALLKLKELRDELNGTKQ